MNLLSIVKVKEKFDQGELGGAYRFFSFLYFFILPVIFFIISKETTPFIVYFVCLIIEWIILLFMVKPSLSVRGFSKKFIYLNFPISFRIFLISTFIYFILYFFDALLFSGAYEHLIDGDELFWTLNLLGIAYYVYLFPRD